MKDERLVSKMDGKANFSRRLKQFDGLTWLTMTPIFLRQIYATGQYRIMNENPDSAYLLQGQRNRNTSLVN